MTGDFEPLPEHYRQGAPVEYSAQRLANWRRRGYYSEQKLVKLLKASGYNAVRIPVSNPSLNPLPDIIARKGHDVFAIENKNVDFYAYFDKHQIVKLFQYLEQFHDAPHENLHAIISAHCGKRWVMKEVSWDDYVNGTLPKQLRILRRDHGTFDYKTFGIDHPAEKVLDEE
jgi:Holliday junction resolvase